MIAHLIVGICVIFLALFAIAFIKDVINIMIYLKLVFCGIIIILIFVAEKTQSEEVLQLLYSAPFIFTGFALIGSAIIFNYVKHYSMAQDVDGDNKC